MGGSCAYPDQSWSWLTALRGLDLCVEASSPLLLFFILGGVAPPWRSEDKKPDEIQASELSRGLFYD